MLTKNTVLRRLLIAVIVIVVVVLGLPALHVAFPTWLNWVVVLAGIVYVFFGSDL